MLWYVVLEKIKVQLEPVGDTWHFHICVFYYAFKLLKHNHFNKNLEEFGHIVVIKGGK